ncbi:MAG: HAMP domain-containing sensor histidine kinase [Bacillota bacterium]
MFKRIFTGYILVLMVSFTVLALAFTLTVRQYLINDTVRSLYRVAETLSASAIQGEIHKNSRMRGAFFKLANRIAYADYVLIEQDGTIIESSDINSYPPGAEMLNEAFLDLAFGDEETESLVERERVAVEFPVIRGNNQSKASLILYSQLDILTQLNRSILGILAFAGGAGAIVSLFAGIFATRYAVGPLKQLKESARELARRNFDNKLEIKTGDELEELADTFNDMAGQLAEYDRSQKEFFQKSSHELKTPLMSIQGYAEALKDGVIPAEEAEQSLDLIIRESGRMKKLVDQFIYLSKMESPHEQYNYEELSLENAVNEAVHAVQSLALENKLEIETNFETKDVIIEADPEKIHRLLLNLLGNALQHADTKVSITVKSGEIHITDDGPGFASEQLKKIFDPFFCRGDKSGSGLGLAISRAIVEKHNGTISAQNMRDRNGAHISVSLPVKRWN